MATNGLQARHSSLASHNILSLPPPPLPLWLCLSTPLHHNISASPTPLFFLSLSFIIIYTFALLLYKRKAIQLCAFLTISIMDAKWYVNRLLALISMLSLLSGTLAFSADNLDQTQLLTFEAVTDAVSLLIDNLGWSKDDVTISDIDTDYAKFGQTTIYDFDVQAGDVFLPLRLSEEITGWQYLDELPFEEDDASELDEFLATLDDEEYAQEPDDYDRDQVAAAILAPFQLAGPVELWIQNAELDLSHDVETGFLRKVWIADGTVVTVEGASEVSLQHPLQLPLPSETNSNKSSSGMHLLALADCLRNASRMAQNPLLSLRIKGPSVLISSASGNNKSTVKNLEVRHLSPATVELFSNKDGNFSFESSKDIPAISETGSWMWPLPSWDASDPKLLHLERLLFETLGPIGGKMGFFNILTAKASAATFVQVEFEVEIKLTNDSFNPEFWPEWRTRPTVDRLQFEVLAKVEGDRLIPVSINQVESYASVDTYTWGELTGNISFSKMPHFFFPSSPMTLDPL